MPNFPYSMILQASGPLLARCLPTWEAAMGSCFHFELLVRLLAQKHLGGESVTRDIGDRGTRPGLLSRLFETLEFSEEEQAFLPKCNTLRNKLIHCEPDGVLRVVRELVPGFDPENRVHKHELPPGGSGEAILETLESQRGAVPVQSTSSRTDGFLGWMIQATVDGTFELAVELLGRGMAIVDSKSDQQSAV